MIFTGNPKPKAEPFKEWTVTIRIRQCGAIGIFYPKVFRVRANSMEQARERGMRDAHAENLEVYCVTHAVEVPE